MLSWSWMVSMFTCSRSRFSWLWIWPLRKYQGASIMFYSGIAIWFEYYFCWYIPRVGCHKTILVWWFAYRKAIYCKWVTWMFFQKTNTFFYVLYLIIFYFSLYRLSSVIFRRFIPRYLATSTFKIWVTFILMCLCCFCLSVKSTCTDLLSSRY